MASETGAIREGADRHDMPVGLSLEDSQLLERSHPNVLMVGTPVAIAAALNALSSSLRPPVVAWHAGEPLALPADAGIRTFILNEVASLSFADQARLLAWLKQSNGATQVVTTTPFSLMPLVDRGEFLEALYYQLNLVYLEIG